MSKVTIKDIAKVAGITPTAVSKALNDKPDISQELKVKVRDIAKEMGYSRNVFARNLVTQKSNTLGIFFLTRYRTNEEDNSGFKFVAGIMQEAQQHHCDMLMFSLDSDMLNERSFSQLCRERNVEGALFIGMPDQDHFSCEIKEMDVPVVLLDSLVSGPCISCVTSDNEKAVTLAMDYLYGLGHRAIGMVKGHELAQVSRRRLCTFELYMREHGLHVSDDWMYQGDFTLRSGYEAGCQIAAQTMRPTALFVASDKMAIGLIRALHDKGLRVPQDISIIGFDNFEVGAYTCPRLSTVGQDLVAMGRTGAQHLIHVLKGDCVTQNIVCMPQLIPRESCARVPDG